jgi:hypothetical protein
MNEQATPDPTPPPVLEDWEVLLSRYGVGPSVVARDSLASPAGPPVAGAAPKVFDDVDLGPEWPGRPAAAPFAHWPAVIFGLVIGAVPQLLLLAYLVHGLVTLPAENPYPSDPAPQEWLGSLALMADVLLIVPVALLVGVGCLFARSARPFGGALLGSTVVGGLIVYLVATSAIDRYS